MSHLFPENDPTDEWYKSFMNRHKDTLVSKYSKNALLNRALSMNPIFFDHWFKLLEKIYDEHNFHAKPTHIFNCDESGISHSSGDTKVVCRKG